VVTETRGAGVRLTGLGKRFGDVTAVHPLDLEIAPGELVVLVGPSGCGKTTVLRMIAGLEDPTSGAVALDGHDVTGVEPADRDIAMVFQNYALYPHMTVAKNLAFGLRMRGMASAEITTRVDRAAAVLGIQDLLDRRPGQLSGGQRQRVALGRATVREPRVFLFDEPLSNLDAKLRAEMRQEIADLHRRLQATMIFVTHDQVEAMTLGQRIAVLHDGRLQQYATPLDVYREPANLFVAGFIGVPGINTVAGVMERGDAAARQRGSGESVSMFRCAAFSAAAGVPVRTGPAVLAVRPEDVELVDSADSSVDLLVEIDRLEPLGNEILVHVRRDPDLRWVVRARADWPGCAGERVGLRLDRTRVHVFDPATGERL
jgi:ABC-type sugar transport system ATPase subunit